MGHNQHRLNTYAIAPARRRPKRVAKKIARRGGALHHAGMVDACFAQFESEALAIVQHMLGSLVGPVRMIGEAIHMALDRAHGPTFGHESLYEPLFGGELP